MTRSLLTFLVVGFSLTMVGQPILAHHSESAEFDSVEAGEGDRHDLESRVAEPACLVLRRRKDESGKITTWGFSNSPPGSLMRRGITKAALKLGAVVNVEGVARAGRFEQRLRAPRHVRRWQERLYGGGRRMKTPLDRSGRACGAALALSATVTSQAQDIPAHVGRET